jgi:pantoate--beta-alanine ligase
VARAVVVSIFVNPLQFGPSEDFARYPRTLAADLAALAGRGVSFVFAPTAEEMYDGKRGTTVTPPQGSDTYEGAIRPGHFAGVLTVVAKLFHIVQPDVAVFGRKDLQQLSLVQRMVRDLDFPLAILPVETVREPDGLALSSRNRYLAPDDRARAPRLQQALQATRARFAAGERDAAALLGAGRGILAADPAIVPDYFEIVRPASFARVAQAEPGDAAIIAARIGGTRLLDNVIL